jgi:hypothetical protein
MEASSGNDPPLRATKKTGGIESFGLDAMKVKSIAAAMITVPDDGAADASAAAGREQHAVSCATHGTRSIRISWTVRVRGGVELSLFCGRVKKVGVREELRQGAGYEWRMTEMKETRPRPVWMDVTVPVSSTLAVLSPKEKKTEPCPWSGIWSPTAANPSLADPLNTLNVRCQCVRMWNSTVRWTPPPSATSGRSSHSTDPP